MEFGVVVVFLGIRPFGTEDETEDKAEEDKPPKGVVQQAEKWSDV